MPKLGQSLIKAHLATAYVYLRHSSRQSGCHRDPGPNARAIMGVLIGEVLRQAGLISSAQAKVARYDQDATGMRFGEVLASRDWVTQETVDFS